MDKNKYETLGHAPEVATLAEEADSFSHEDAGPAGIASPSTAPPRPLKPKARKVGSVQKIWGKELGQKWTPVSDYFLENFHRLANGSVSPSDAMFIVMLMRFKWDDRNPYPALTTVAKSMNRSVRYVRQTCARLEKAGLLQREKSSKGGRNRYNLQPLFDALEAQKAQEAA